MYLKIIKASRENWLISQFRDFSCKNRAYAADPLA